MVGGDAVAENAESARTFDFSDCAGLQTEIAKEWRFLDVGTVGVPLINISFCGGNFVPLGILLGEIAVELAEDLGLESGLHLVANFLQGGPDLSQINVFAVVAFADRFFAEINVHAASQREGYHQRR